MLVLLDIVVIVVVIVAIVVAFVVVASRIGPLRASLEAYAPTQETLVQSRAWRQAWRPTPLAAKHTRARAPSRPYLLMTAHGLRNRILDRDPVVGVFLLERVPLVPLRGLPVLQGLGRYPTRNAPTRQPTASNSLIFSILSLI